MKTSRLPTETPAPRSEDRTSRRSGTLTHFGARPPAPTVLERYRLHRRLGTGAFGTVWLARDERLERDVAVKVLARERVIGGRFEREARVAARLAHPGIVTLYEAAVDDEGAYLVSELVRGATLSDLLEAGRLSDRDIVEIGIALCDALAYAHAQGVVHRDVKPSNVLIPDQPASPAQLAKLTDFGVARLMGGESLTMTGDVIGTLAYMAPEQAQGLHTGAAADLYSLALVLYEALSGVNPVRTSTAAAHARRLGAHLPPLRRQRRDLPRELGQGIDLALRPRPDDRGTVIELRRMLNAACDQVGDEPGIVSAPWTRRSDAAGIPTPSAFADRESPDRESPDRESAGLDDDQGRGAPRISAPRWLGRGLGAAATAATAAWLTGGLLAPAPLAPAVAGLLAGALTLVFPRAAWLALAVAACATAGLQDHPGAAMVLLVAMLTPVVLLLRRGTDWPLAAAAPALGLIGLAGAWPALAGRAGTPLRRAALGAAGWVLLLLATPATGRTLYLPRLAGTPPDARWVSSWNEAAHHVLWPLVSSGTLAGAGVWALGAMILPWLSGGRWPALDFLRIVVWAALLASATGAVISATNGGTGLPMAPTAAVGAVAGAALALAAPVFAAARDARQGTGSTAGFP